MHPFYSLILAIVCFFAAVLQYATIRCVHLPSVRTAKVLFIAGFLILTLRFTDLFLSGVEFTSVHIALFAIFVIALGSIIANIERVLESKERRKQRDIG